jgi:ABC-type Na+ efflux pump permease subunit
VKNSSYRLFITALVMLLVASSALHLCQVCSSQVSGNAVVRVQPATTAVRVDETFSVNVTVESVQNLYGLDVTLRWNSSVLQFQSVDLRLGVESHPDGVLHEDSNTEIYIAENEASEAEYRLAATAVGPASSFNGSGTVFRINFKATTLGRSTLELETELADRPPLGETSNLIEHTTVLGSVESTANGISEPTGLDWLILILIAMAVIVLAIGVIVYLRKRKEQNAINKHFSPKP